MSHLDATNTAAASRIGANDDGPYPATVDCDSQASERRRVQELLRYFQPSGAGMDLTQKPRLSSDLALNAFAQLAALKLNCQRSFISLMDHEHQYIIAECTRSMSLESADTYEVEGDALLTGATTLDLKWGVCASTISVFNSTDGSLNTVSQYMKAEKDYYIMNDMSKLPEYKDRPYVAGWPHMKYYVSQLEVPIHSPSGLAIGTICGVTNEPREGIDYKAITILNEIASAVMDHLDLVVSRVQRKRAERMINGLGLFAEGSEDRHWRTKRKGSTIEVEENMRRLTVQKQEGSVVELGSPGHDEVMSNQNVAASASSDSFDIGMVQTQEGADKPLIQNDVTPPIESTADVQGLDSGLENKVASLQTMTTEASTTNTSSKTNTDAAKPSQESPGLSTDVDGTLARATRLIREAVDLNGVTFFDSRASTPVRYAETITNPSHLQTNSVDVDIAPPNQTSLPRSIHTFSPHTEPSLPGEIFSRVLSSSISNGTTAFPSRFPENLLHHLLDHFPRGGILEFDADANLVSRYELDIPIGRPSPATKSQEPVTAFDAAKSPPRSVGETDFLTELRKIAENFPGARKIILFPLTLSSEKLFAYAIGFTVDATRVLQREDFTYITSFSNLIMAELSRIDTANADLAKSRFISSISHELRSPLHGMLASAELLKGSISDTTSLDIIDTIEACGSTLLDTLDNLLTFAKINNFAMSRQRKISTSEKLSSGHGMAENIKSLTSEVDLPSLVEEVMNASIAGHHFRTSPNQNLSFTDGSGVHGGSVIVICDVAFSPNWIFDTQAGAWKRILMNLLGNSLKYTASGVIKVTIQQEKGGSSTSGQQDTRVCLSVEDTGKGISADFLANHLYKPFRQENELQPGTGLGLSIVKQLVSSIGGHVDVNSEYGSGTTVSVSAFLTTSVNVPTSPTMTSLYSRVSSKLKGLKVGLLGLDPHLDTQDTATGILSREAKTCQALKSTLVSGISVFGCQSVTVNSMNAVGVDIIVTTEDDYQYLLAKNMPARKVPVILLCTSTSLDYRHVSFEGGPTTYLSQPFGPQRLARALEICQQYFHAGAKNTKIKGQFADTTLKTNAFAPATSTLSSSIESTSIPAPSESFDFPPALSQGGQPRVLLVEDNAINLRLLVTIVTKLKCPYATATDGQQAVDSYIVTNGSFDIVFMDIQMPNMDGLAASLEIRRFEQQFRLKRSTIIAITGLASAEVQEQARLSGIDSLLTKPVPMKTLRRIIERQSAA